MNDLRILIARLGWPMASTRWWAMQELAIRLGNDDSKLETEDALLQLLKSRKLEAEVIEMLFIFWMAVQKYEYSPVIELSQAVPLSSVLSKLLIESLELPTSLTKICLKEAPLEFQIPESFISTQGINVSKVFITSLRQLESSSGFPFVKQMAFELQGNLSAYPDVPVQGGLAYFSRSLGKNLIPVASERLSLRAMSAYLRTLSVAEARWGMPTEIAIKYSLKALPIHPSLAFLQPKIPKWVPVAMNFVGEKFIIEEYLRDLLIQFKNLSSGDELIAFNSPVEISQNKYIEVSLVQWLQAPGSTIDDLDLVKYLDDFWNYKPVISSAGTKPMSIETTIISPSRQSILEPNCNAWPLVGVLDWDRIGYLQHDLYPSRLFFPITADSNSLKIRPRNGGVEVQMGGERIADLLYWNAGWTSSRLKQLGGSCGTALVSKGKKYREGVNTEIEGTRSFYLWRVVILEREDCWSEYVETEMTGILFSDF
ncbi:MAG: hypothetical protein KBT75_17000 [Oleispira antarctica]|nr:hypothetical protein [Oleispira antarctica]MBQ0794124.1 hypothetical protein [Oleispira antarctica]